MWIAVLSRNQRDATQAEKAGRGHSLQWGHLSHAARIHNAGSGGPHLRVVLSPGRGAALRSGLADQLVALGRAAAQRRRAVGHSQRDSMQAHKTGLGISPVAEYVL